VIQEAPLTGTGFTQTTYTISELESRSGEVYSIQHYMIKFVSDLRQVGGYSGFLHQTLKVKGFGEPNIYLEIFGSKQKKTPLKNKETTTVGLNRISKISYCYLFIRRVQLSFNDNYYI
jgi:hypothetical protein